MQRRPALVIASAAISAGIAATVAVAAASGTGVLGFGGASADPAPTTVPTTVVVVPDRADRVDPTAPAPTAPAPAVTAPAVTAEQPLAVVTDPDAELAAPPPPTTRDDRGHDDHGRDDHDGDHDHDDRGGEVDG